MTISARMLRVLSWPLRVPFSLAVTYPMAGMMLSPCLSTGTRSLVDGPTGMAGTRSARTDRPKRQRRTGRGEIVAARGAAFMRRGRISQGDGFGGFDRP